MKKLFTLLAVFTALSVAKAQTVWTTIQGSPDHTTLTQAIQLAGLEGTLNSPGTFTVFAPTDDAFASVDPDVLAAVLNDPNGLLTDILLYHVLGTTELSSDLTDGQMLPTLLGQDLTVTSNMSGIFVNDAQVTVPNLTSTNGVVHVINSVLLPMAEETSVWDIIVASPAHTTLETAVLLAGLEGALDAPGTLTVFAPTDDAFAAVDPDVLAAILADPNGLLTDILLYHVLGTTELSSDLMDGQMLTTLFGEDVTVTIDMGVFINDAQVTGPDLTADNGVVHVIDGVLVPAAEETSVWDIIVASPAHTTLETAVLLAGLEGALDAPGTLTVFAPTDDAFAAVDPDVLAAILADPSGLLTDILLYHVLGSTELSSDLMDGQMLTTLFGADVNVTINMDGVFINDAEVIFPDLTADNGVVHVIDGVLVPAEETSVWDIIVASPVHETLETAVLLAGLEGALDAPGTLTVFAPTDDAFAAVDPDVLAAILADPSGLLTDILLYHVLGTTELSSDLMDGSTYPTLFGESVLVTVDMGVFINTAQVTFPDLTADNGVVHVIDQVLVPITLSVSEQNETVVSMFPNPATDNVQLTLESSNQNASYQMISSTGSIVQNGLLTPGNNTLSVENLSSGVYILNIMTDTGFSVERLMVK